MQRVGVVGSGVIGLSIAHELAAAGHAVTVVADSAPTQTVSAVAAAVWFPYLTDATPRAAHRLDRSLRRFEALGPVPGVRRAWGTVVERTPSPDRGWTAVVARWTDAVDLPPGAASGIRALLPVIETGLYLPWLHDRCTELGVRFEHRSVGSLHEVPGDSVVVAAGLASPTLVGGDAEPVWPVRGQVVRLVNPGIDEWIVDEAHPDGLTYVVPRSRDVVCGGTSEPHGAQTDPDPAVREAIIARAVRLQPALAGQPVLSEAVGLRPARREPRVEVVPGHARPVIACYGHGGAGVTLSWGCAEEVASLVAAA